MTEKQQAILIEGYYLSIFPVKQKKSPTSPDYTGSISKGKMDSLGDVSLYRKPGTLKGYFYGIPDKLPLIVEMQSENFTDAALPAITGTIQIGDGPKHSIKLYAKSYKNGTYYSGKIGSSIMDR